VYLLVAVSEKFLIDDREERILYSRTSLPYLIKEHHIGRWQIPFNGTLIPVRSFQEGD